MVGGLEFGMHSLVEIDCLTGRGLRFLKAVARSVVELLLALWGQEARLFMMVFRPC